VGNAGGPLGCTFHTLLPLEDFRAILGLDDREDALSRHCLLTATYTIEHYCRRRLVKTVSSEQIAVSKGELCLSLREYPVRRILSVYAVSPGTVQPGEPLLSPENLVDPQYYYCLPDEGIREDIPFSLVLRPPFRLTREEMGIRVRYLAGYVPGKAGTLGVPATPNGVPSDLASACLELAAWNMARYRGRRIGMSGNVRGSGKEGEHLEASMPEQVRFLLEPYQRRMV
jgi:hypothetical protein